MHKYITSLVHYSPLWQERRTSTWLPTPTCVGVGDGVGYKKGTFQQIWAIFSFEVVWCFLKDGNTYCSSARLTMQWCNSLLEAIAFCLTTFDLHGFSAEIICNCVITVEVHLSIGMRQWGVNSAQNNWFKPKTGLILYL